MKRAEDGTKGKQLRTRWTGARIMKMLQMVMMSLVMLQAADVAGMAVAAAEVDVKVINELETYTGIKQGPESYKYYQMKLGPRYFTGTQNMIFKVLATAFQSDPDVYISRKNKYPTSSKDAEWYCVREGSETCVLHRGEFTEGETFYVGVHCVRECEYTLRVWLGNIIDLTENVGFERTLMSFAADSTQILRYYIPAAITERKASRKTESVVVKVEPEDRYSEVDAYLSLDSNFYIIEEAPASHLMANGVAIKFGKADESWCVQCYIYVILNVRKAQRYYITSHASRAADPFTEKVDVEVMVNPFQ